jgi:pyruvate ferredoxin oxidoreductase alpha subunit
VVEEVSREFAKEFGRSYDLLDCYRLDDADTAIVILNSAAGTTKVAVDNLREQGRKVGVLRPRLYRPFPHAEIAEALKGKKAVAVLDRADSMNGFGGPLFNEIRSALYDSDSRPAIFSRIYGLGGRDYKVEHAVEVFDELDRVAETGKVENLTGYLAL